MPQQATLRVHADRRVRSAVAFHPSRHLDSHEERGHERLHGLFGVPSAAATRRFSASSLEQLHEPLAAR
ncbi:MAG: hypothetical protein M0Z46_17930 [Actinomycetota bacterium]|jgi:hypothetical protein|nr:hypothetical protein [Actinomycetota bacterium]MDA8356513.1 hypothetical protein [Actinomycetota bacterium]